MYIIVAGVVAVVPIVLGIVLCKKARERKRKVQYCRGEPWHLCVVGPYFAICTCESAFGFNYVQYTSISLLSHMCLIQP